MLTFLWRFHACHTCFYSCSSFCQEYSFITLCLCQSLIYFLKSNLLVSHKSSSIQHNQPPSQLTVFLFCGIFLCARVNCLFACLNPWHHLIWTLIFISVGTRLSYFVSLTPEPVPLFLLNAVDLMSFYLSQNSLYNCFWKGIPMKSIIVDL